MATDVSMMTRGDELGTLSQSFYGMVAELADARRRLIEASEEEIRIQNERLNAAIGKSIASPTASVVSERLTAPLALQARSQCGKH